MALAQIKLRIELNKGRTGAPLEKLGDVARQFDKFLRALAGDLKLDMKKSEWLAVNFKNGSVSWDAAFQGDLPEAAARRFNGAIEFLADFDPETDGTNGIVSDASLLEYGKLGECIDPDEVIGLGIYPLTGGRPKMRQVEYRRTLQIRQKIEAPIKAYGSVQGLLHSLVKEVTEPYFRLLDLSNQQNLVRCFYGNDLYGDVVNVLKERKSIIHASGSMDLDRAKRTIETMHVERIDKIEPLSDDEFEAFIGSVPNLTGDLSTEEYIEHLRTDGE